MVKALAIDGSTYYEGVAIIKRWVPNCIQYHEEEFQKYKRITISDLPIGSFAWWWKQFNGQLVWQGKEQEPGYLVIFNNPDGAASILVPESNVREI